MKWLVLAAAIAGAAYGYIWRDNTAKAQIASIELTHLRSTTALKNKIELAEAANAKIFAELEKLRVEKNQVVIKQVIKYVQSDSPKCSLSADWVRIHDSAAMSDGIRATASAADDAASGVTDDQALMVIADNYQTCQSIRAQLSELQGWIRAHAS